MREENERNKLESEMNMLKERLSKINRKIHSSQSL